MTETPAEPRPLGIDAGHPSATTSRDPLIKAVRSAIVLADSMVKASAKTGRYGELMAEAWEALRRLAAARESAGAERDTPEMAAIRTRDAVMPSSLWESWATIEQHGGDIGEGNRAIRDRRALIDILNARFPVETPDKLRESAGAGLDALRRGLEVAHDALAILANEANWTKSDAVAVSAPSIARHAKREVDAALAAARLPVEDSATTVEHDTDDSFTVVPRREETSDD